MPAIPFLWVGGSALGGYIMGVTSDTSKVIGTVVVIGGAYYLLTKKG
jgi:hypothetical protein